MAETVTRRHGDLQTGEDIARERREWVVQRVGWGAMALFLAAGLAGLLGSGPLSKASRGETGLKVDYQRIARLNSPARLEVRAVAVGPALRLTLSASYARDAGLTRIAPEPVEVGLEGDRYIYEFPVAGGGEQRVIFHLEPDKIGSLETDLGVVDGPTVTFTQFVVP